MTQRKPITLEGQEPPQCHCPACGSTETGVVKTEDFRADLPGVRGIVRRTRQCHSCGAKFRTFADG